VTAAPVLRFGHFQSQANRSLSQMFDDFQMAEDLAFDHAWLVDFGTAEQDLAHIVLPGERLDGDLEMALECPVGSLWSDLGHRLADYAHGRERIVPMGATARRALNRYLATRAAVASADPLFASRRGTPLTPRGVQLAIARLGRRAGVGTRCSPHTFRHTLARGYPVNRGDVFSLQQTLGDGTITVVHRRRKRPIGTLPG
jgi:integrase